MANALRLAFIVFLSVLLGAEWFAFVAGYGLSYSLVIVCAVALIVMVVYVTWDYCRLEEEYCQSIEGYIQLRYQYQKDIAMLQEEIIRLEGRDD